MGGGGWGREEVRLLSPLSRLFLCIRCRFLISPPGRRACSTEASFQIPRTGNSSVLLFLPRSEGGDPAAESSNWTPAEVLTGSCPSVPG